MNEKAVLAPQGADHPAGQMDAEQAIRREDASEGKSREGWMPRGWRVFCSPPSI